MWAQPAQTVPQLIKVFGAILETNTVDEDVERRIGAALKNLQQPPFAEFSVSLKIVPRMLNARLSLYGMTHTSCARPR